MNPAISIKNLKKSYNGTEVFRDFTMTIERNKISAIFGPNGSGKSTILNILSGILSKESGDIYINDFNRFRTSYIFQNYRESLLPWRTNFENIALPLEVQRIPEQEIRRKVEELQIFFAFPCNWDDYPYQLSGGQQQILSFMRALVNQPELLFIDEPFSALDYENNLLLRERLQKYYLTFKPTILIITHNIEEAVHLAEKIIVFSKKPTRIVKVIENPAAYPRTIEFLMTEQFHLIKDQVLSVFQKEVDL